MTTSKTRSTIILRPALERGHAQHGWLDSYHTFSFADYYDSRHMGFRTLRVINEDRVEPGQGFGEHPHRDMEIFSYVISGALKHQDSLGQASVLKAGDVQKITAGSGIVHSEFNASLDEPVHFFQIWILPEKKGLTPSYQEHSLVSPDRTQPLLLLGSPQGGSRVLKFYQDIFIYRGTLEPEQSCAYAIQPGRGVWLQMVKGRLQVNGHALSQGDGAAVEQVAQLTITAQEKAEFLLFDTI